MKKEKGTTNGGTTNGEPRFTFEEVKDMIEKVLHKQNRAGSSATASLKRVDFQDIAAEGHSVESCKELLEQLVFNTRRVRTLREVLTDIKDNLKKSKYTEIIARTSVKGDLPKKPPSAYLLYHADRYNELRNNNHLAIEISKIVAEEWKTLPEKKRRHYHRKQEEMVQNYERKMKNLGLVDDEAPKRPKSAKTLYVDHCMSQLVLNNWTKEDISNKREKFGLAFDSLSSEDKKYWTDCQKANLEKYKAERQAFVEAHPHLSHQINNLKKPRKDEKIKVPEPPRTALKFFIAKKLPTDLEGEQLEAAIKSLKEKFSSLREKKLLKYIKKAVQDKERYEKEVEEFNKKYPDRVLSKGPRTNLTKEQMKLYTKVVENRPEPPAPTAYLYFCGKKLTDMNLNDDELTPPNRMRFASESWRNANSKEKKNAIRTHSEDIERYIHEMERWLASQTEERRLQVLSEDPKVSPDYWRKKLNRMKKKAVIKEEKK